MSNGWTTPKFAGEGAIHLMEITNESAVDA